MFDISFSELLVIGAIALVVIGPARLPGVARTVGHLLGRAQRYVNDVKADIRREVELDELRTLKTQMNEAAQEVHSTLHAGEEMLRAGQASLQATFETPVMTANEGAADVSAAAPITEAAAVIDTSATQDAPERFASSPDETLDALIATPSAPASAAPAVSALSSTSTGNPS